VTFNPGDIVMVHVPDPDGNPCAGEHPAMVLMTSATSLDAWVVAISTSIDRPLPANCIELPWQVGGHPVTGLWRQCVLKCHWYTRVPKNQIRTCIGKVPTALLETAVDKVSAEHRKRESAKAAANPTRR
jgi:mRNA-degrading endonuclease toxin of MazEF toxin-antitoxin module